MRFKFAVAGMCLLGTLAGCGNAVPATETLLTAAEQLALKYVTQPQCPAGTTAITCADPATVAKIKAADNVAFAAVTGWENGTVSQADAVAAINALSALIPITS